MENSFLTVKIDSRIVGRLAMTDKRCCAFEYSSEWLANGFSISPLKLPLQKGLFIAKPSPFEGNFGIFNDSLPDGWGRLLLNRMLEKEGKNELELNALERLSLIGNHGLGALCYEPTKVLNYAGSFTYLSKLQEEAANILSEKESDSLEELYARGGSSGGARPKCLLQIEDRNWLVKFRNKTDPSNVGEIEYNYSLLAKECGIQMPETRLFENRFFGTERFDIENGKRIHTATASGLLDADFREVSLDYIAILQLTGYLTQNAMEVEQMYRRMVFNVAIGNMDDHAKNFSFLCHNGEWSVSPAYDLLPSAGFNGQHTTTINGSGKPNKDDLFAVARNLAISDKKSKLIYEQVWDTIRTHKL